MSKYGIDVSEHNGQIDWSLAKNNIEFCFLRGGYGSNNIDKRFHYNAKECNKNKIPFGIYWFSYALSVEDARKEANYACNLADDYSPSLPIAFDWEYDSDKFAARMGKAISNQTRVSFAVAFMDEVKKRGYKPLLYTNPDYIHNKGFVKLINLYPIWLAQWGTNKPTVNCEYWQTSTQGCVNGIKTNVDVDISYIVTDKAVNFSDIVSTAESKYKNIAYDIIDGKYGIGETREKMLKDKGYDYELAQQFVNRILSEG